MTFMDMTWDGEDPGEMTDPSAADVERQIHRLDGRARTIVMIQRGEAYLAVGGSAADGLVVYAELDDGEFWSALSPETTSKDKVIVVAGSQPGDYEARFVTAEAVAVRAAKAFLAAETLASDVQWEKN